MNREWFAADLQSASVAISIADISQPDCPLIYVNDAFEKLTGFSSEVAIGRNCRFLQTKRTDAVDREAMRTALAMRTPCQGVLVNQRANGDAFLNLLVMKPLSRVNSASFVVGCQFDATRLGSIDLLRAHCENMRADLRGGPEAEITGRFFRGHLLRARSVFARIESRLMQEYSNNLRRSSEEMAGRRYFASSSQ